MLPIGVCSTQNTAPSSPYISASLAAEPARHRPHPNFLRAFSHNMNSPISKETEKICVLCCQEVEVFAVGKCDHPVCYRCSTKMRVLCDQKYCAVCREELDKVGSRPHCGPRTGLLARPRRRGSFLF